MMADILALAKELYAEVGEDIAMMIPIHRLARALWKQSNAVEVVAPMALRSKNVALVRVKNTWRIMVRRGLPLDQANNLVAREVSRWALRRAGMSDDDETADALASVLTGSRQASPGLAKARSPDRRRITSVEDLDAFSRGGRLASL